MEIPKALLPLKLPMNPRTTSHNLASSSPEGTPKPAGVSKVGQAAEPYEQVMAQLRARMNIEAVRPAQVDRDHAFDLNRMRALMLALGSPQTSFRTIHIAGSKGKGSVSEMLASCLTACKYTVGLYTSPHLIDLRERIRLQGSMIPRPDFARTIAHVMRVADELPKGLQGATHFEILTASAFAYFAEQAVDYAVIEVGMGGEFDATNLIQPDVSVITALQLEHVELLGGTLASIAKAKAGIMKPGVPCYTIDQPPEAMAVLQSTADRVGCQLRVLGKNVDFSCRLSTSVQHGPHAKVCLTGKKSLFEHIVVPLIGEHQAPNCGLVLGVLDALREKGVSCPDGLVAEGLRRTPLNGRLEKVAEGPPIYIDGAHNPESVKAVVRAVAAHLRPDSLVVVFGCASDKDVAKILPGIASGADKVIFTRAEGSDRSVDPRELQRKFAEISSRMSQVGPTLKDAIQLAKRAVARGDIILITGSFLLAGQAKKLLLAEADTVTDVKSRVGSNSEPAPSSILKRPKPPLQR